MRHAIVLSLFALSALPAPADTIIAPATVDQVILFNWGATVSRSAAITAAAGLHQIIIPDLPFDTSADSLRVSGTPGLTIGAVSLSTDRLPATPETLSPQVAAAQAEVERLEAVLRDRDAAIAAVRLRVEAVDEQVAFLRALGQGITPDALTAETLEQLRALSQMVGSEVLAARQLALAAETEAGELDRARVDDQEALDLAWQALAAIQNHDAATAAAVLTVETTGEPGQITVTTQTAQASWYPVYDLRLTTGEAPLLVIDRGVVVSQYSGEDWLGVDLTMSTARPSGQSGPSELYPWLRSIVDEADLTLRATLGDGFATEMMAAPMVVVEPDASRIVGADMGMIGQTVVYHYGQPVDLRDGVDALRLKLDTLDLVPTVRAMAVPSRDAVAYLVASFDNSTAETLLPGPAQLYLDGALTGSTQLPLVAVGDDMDLGFGALDGIILTRAVPNRSEGEAGIITSSNQINEEAVLRIENLTGRSWPLRVLDQVPYSEQDDLAISYRADPPATLTDLDDMRGVLAWDFEIAAGETREIRLQTSLNWPTDFMLQ